MMNQQTLIKVALVCVIAGAPARAELPEHYPMALSIDDQEVGQVRTARDIRAAFAKCHPPKSCSSIYMERDPQIFFAANFERGGYTIGHRTGPPGPEFEARRKAKGNPTHFTTAEMIRITADYIEGRKTPFVRWKSTPLP
jgi:hypothetical protein